MLFRSETVRQEAADELRAKLEEAEAKASADMKQRLTEAEAEAAEIDQRATEHISQGVDLIVNFVTSRGA